MKRRKETQEKKRNTRKHQLSRSTEVRMGVRTDRGRGRPRQRNREERGVAGGNRRGPQAEQPPLGSTAWSHVVRCTKSRHVSRVVPGGPGSEDRIQPSLTSGIMAGHDHRKTMQPRVGKLLRCAPRPPVGGDLDVIQIQSHRRLSAVGLQI